MTKSGAGAVVQSTAVSYRDADATIEAMAPGLFRALSTARVFDALDLANASAAAGFASADIPSFSIDEVFVTSSFSGALAVEATPEDFIEYHDLADGLEEVQRILIEVAGPQAYYEVSVSQEAEELLLVAHYALSESIDPDDAYAIHRAFMSAYQSRIPREARRLISLSCESFEDGGRAD